eukprot:350820-Chlamydomonas_euryale.AAC.5
MSGSPRPRCCRPHAAAWAHPSALNVAAWQWACLPQVAAWAHPRALHAGAWRRQSDFRAAPWPRRCPPHARA